MLIHNKMITDKDLFLQIKENYLMLQRLLLKAFEETKDEQYQQMLIETAQNYIKVKEKLNK